MSERSPRRRLPSIHRLPWTRIATALLIATAVALLHLLVWRLVQAPQALPEAPIRIAGLAYNAFQRHDSPLDGRYPSDESIAEDLATLAKLSGRIRTYGSSEFPALPGLAERHGLRLTAGVWLDRRMDNNERELAAIERAVARHPNIDRVIAGNETLLLSSLEPEQLIAYLDRLRRTLSVPVSTAEPWHVWLKRPELADHVDFLTVHLLPYWEGVPAEAAVDYAMMRLEELRKRFPGKPIVIGEVGWPSGGDRVDGARASPADQATFVRGFLARSRGLGLDYFLMEAVDQPWKRATEGRAGAYWGILDADRQPKFSFDGPLNVDRHERGKAGLASLAGFLLIALSLSLLPRLRLAARIGFAVTAQGVVTLTVLLATLPMKHYLEHLDWIVLALLAPALALTAVTLLAQLFEFAELFWDGNLRRRFGPKPLPRGAREPRVSIHLACCNEPPAMVIATLDSLMRLDWRNFEVLVIDNNTRDPALWQPVQAHCERLAAARGTEGPTVRFFHLPSWPGYKAGALNFALQHTDPAAEVVAVVDADYLVEPNWLRDLVAHFDDAKVGVVQSPQAHRDWEGQAFRRAMNWEYDGFFRIGMHHRNERDAIIQHGTMTMIRASALRDGGWSEWCICEDSELGLRLMQRGLRAVYVDRVMGRGLTPDGFVAFKKQRQRWAQGAMQILKAHARSLLGLKPAAGQPQATLRRAQRYHFVAGWLPWLGDAMHLVLSFATLFWTIGLIAAPQWFSLPAMLFLGPLTGLMSVRLLIGPLLYLKRVPCRPAGIVGAALAGLSLSHAIARGVFAGLTQRTAVFEVTQKGSAAGAAARRGGPVGVREEAGLFGALMLALAAVAWVRPADHVESLMWLGVLALQAVPYAAALVCAWMSRWAARPTAPLPQAPGPAGRRRGGAGGRPVAPQRPRRPALQGAVDLGPQVAAAGGRRGRAARRAALRP